MKKRWLSFTVLLFLSTIWFSCNKTEDGSYVEPITVSEKINGQWQILSLTMIDEAAKSAGIKPDEVPLTDQFSFNTFGITLNVDSENNATDYSISGNAPGLIAPAGYWALDSNFPRANGTPIVINLYTDAAKTQLANQISIASMPGGSEQMDIKLIHTSNGVAYVSYLYSLVPSN